MGGPSVKKCFFCGNLSDKKNSIALHSFPRKADNEAAFWNWLEVCGLAENTSLTTKRICSKHFKPDDFTCGNVGGHLVRSAVPSQELPKLKGISSSFDYSTNISSSKCPGLAAPTENGGFVFIEVEGLPSLPTSQIFDLNTVHVSTGDDQSQSEAAERSSPTILNRSSPPPAQQADEIDASVPMSPDNSPISAGASETPNTPKARRFGKARFVSEIMPSDFATPQTAARTLEFVKDVHKEKIRQIKRLQDTNRKLLSKVAVLKAVIKQLKGDGEIPENSNNSPQVEELGEELKTADCTSQSYNLAALKKDLKEVKLGGLPTGWGCAFGVPNAASFVHFEEGKGGEDIKRSIHVQSDMSVQIRAKGKLTSFFQSDPISSAEHALRLMKTVAGFQLCVGVGDGSCVGEGFIQPGQRVRCESCTKHIRIHARRNFNKTVNEKRRTQKLYQGRKERKNMQRQLRRLKNQLEKKQEQLEDLRARCAQAEEQ